MKEDLHQHFPPAPERDSAPWRALQAVRKVTCWPQFPAATKAIYLTIARCYPGVQLHACGSRVKGYYADPGDTEAITARRAMGHPDRTSDFDFIAPPGAKPVCPLPPLADQAHEFPREGCSIPIPVYHGT